MTNKELREQEEWMKLCKEIGALDCVFCEEADKEIKCMCEHHQGKMLGYKQGQIKALEEIEKIIEEDCYMQHGLPENCPKYCNLCLLKKALKQKKEMK